MLQSHLDPNVCKRIDKVDKIIKKYARQPSIASTVSGTEDEVNTENAENRDSDDVPSCSNWSLGSVDSLIITHSFDDLPDSVLLNVFRFLSEEELRETASQVSQKWMKAARHPALRSRLRYADTPTEKSMLILRELRESGPNLTELRLYRIGDAVSVVRQLCRCNIRLKVLHIKYCTADVPRKKTPGKVISGESNEELNAIPESVFLNVLASLPNLEELNLKGTVFRARRFYQQLAGARKLRVFGFGANPLLRNNDILGVAFNCRQIERLNVSRRPSNVSLTGQDIRFAFSSGGGLPGRLTSLKFDATGLDPQHYNELLKCQRLDSLTLNNAVNLDGVTFRAFPTQFPRLRSLKIRNGFSLTSEDFIVTFTEGKQTMQQIQALDFASCWKLDDRALNAICNVCCRELRQLRLACCKAIRNITPVGSCSALEALDVAYVPGADAASLRALCAPPTRLPNLRTLVVGSPNDDSAPSSCAAVSGIARTSGIIGRGSGGSNSRSSRHKELSALVRALRKEKTLRVVSTASQYDMKRKIEIVG